MTSNDLRKKFLDFFKSKGHAILPSASLIPREDPTVLFTTAGMHPLVPFLMGQKHPSGTRLASSQKCIRTGDIEEVGDNRHLTFFEMLGNWSLGDYFKKEAIAWSFEFLTSKDWLGLEPKRIYVSVFEGDSDAPRDDESIALWKGQFNSVGIDANVGVRIFTYGKDKNWWGPAGATGPCGPDTEMFYDTLALPRGDAHAPAWVGKGPCHPNCDCGRYVEIWNDVFMEYEKPEARSPKSEVRYEFVPLTQKNVDTGMGLERTAMVLQGVPTVFDADLFRSLITKIAELSQKTYGSNPTIDRAMRIMADHLKAATFIIGDDHGVGPSNIDQGYVVRRLIRRAIRFGRSIGIRQDFTAAIAEQVLRVYGAVYPGLEEHRDRIISELKSEEAKFSKTLELGLREVERLLKRGGDISGEEAFVLFSTYGFPLEMTEEIAKERGAAVDAAAFQNAFLRHQQLSRVGAEKKFSGGLADHSVETTRLHTANHLVLQALKNVLGPEVNQRGSNITAERLRFDFSWEQKLTPEQIAAVEGMVNEQVAKDLLVHYEVMPLEEAKRINATGVFEERYAQDVKVYFIGPPAQYYSREICGGPHVRHTSQVGQLKIVKEEAVSSGVRRIKAVVSGGSELQEGEAAEEGIAAIRTS